MALQSIKIILNELPEPIRNAISALSVSTTLNDKIATQLLKNTAVANGNAGDIVQEIKRLPIVVQRSENYWSIGPEAREIALQMLNGSKLKYQEKAIEILKSQPIDYSSNVPFLELRDFELQTLRLGLKVSSEQKDSIEKIRSIFDADEDYNNHNNTKLFVNYIDESISLNELKEYPLYILSAMYIKGLYLYKSKDYKAAINTLLPVLNNYDEDSYTSVKDAGIAAHLIGLIYTKDRSFEEAEKAYQKSLALKIPINDILGLAHVYHSLGNLLSKTRNRFTDAENAYQESIKIGRQIKNDVHLAQVYHSLGNLLSKEKSRYIDAENAYQESLNIRTPIDDKYGLAQVYHSLGNLLSKEKNRFNDAENAYQKSIDLEKLNNNRYGLAQVYHSLGNLFSKTEDRFFDAEKAYRESINIGKQINNNSHLAQVYHSLGNLYSKDSNRFDVAEYFFNKSLFLEEKNKNKNGLAQVYTNYGKLKILQKDYTKAKELFEKSLKYQTDSKFIKLVKDLIYSLPL